MTGGNANYKKGRRKENYICEKLKRNGWTIAQRSAGSHSPIDVFAFHKENKRIKLIQSKPNNFSKSQEKKILEENDWLNGKFEVEFVVE